MSSVQELADGRTCAFDVPVLVDSDLICFVLLRSLSLFDLLCNARLSVLQ